MGRTKKEGYFSLVLNEFWMVFRHIDRKSIPITIYDALFMITFFFTFGLIARVIVARVKGLFDLDLRAMVESQDSAIDTFNYIQNTSNAVILYVAIGIVMLLTIWALFKGLAWAATYRKRATFPMFTRLFMVNTVLAIIFGMLSYALIKDSPQLVRQRYALMLLVLLAHFSWIAYATVIRDVSAKKAFANLLRIGFLKIHMLALPYLLITAGFFVVLFITGLASFLPAVTQGILVLSALIAYFAIIKLYLKKVFDAINP